MVSIFEDLGVVITDDNPVEKDFSARIITKKELDAIETNLSRIDSSLVLENGRQRPQDKKGHSGYEKIKNISTILFNK